MPKPGDLLLSVIAFFGILIPGAVLILLPGMLLLRGEDIWTAAPTWVEKSAFAGGIVWVAGFFASYILGHFLLALSELLLDPLAMRIPFATRIPWEQVTRRIPWEQAKKKTEKYCEEVREHGALPERVLRTEGEEGKEHIAKHKKLKAIAHFTFRFIRIKNSDAIADIERNAADYKLFRSLMLVFFLDIVISALSPLLSDPFPPLWRFVASIAGLLLSWRRFYLAFNWTYQLGFDFYLQLYTPTVTFSTPAVTFSPAVLDFGAQQAGNCSNPKIVTLKNISSAPLTLTSVSLNGANCRDFHLDRLSCEGSILLPGCSYTVHILFTPKEIGNCEASLTFNIGGLHIVPLSGQSLDPQSARDVCS
jgi:Transmembrane protein 131-like N-terminal